MLQQWHLEKGSQGPVDLGLEPTEAERRPYAIHQSGKWYTNENIDQMLMERHLNKKARWGSHKNHIKGCRTDVQWTSVLHRPEWQRRHKKAYR